MQDQTYTESTMFGQAKLKQSDRLDSLILSLQESSAYNIRQNGADKINIVTRPLMGSNTHLLILCQGLASNCNTLVAGDWSWIQIGVLRSQAIGSLHRRFLVTIVNCCCCRDSVTFSALRWSALWTHICPNHYLATMLGTILISQVLADIKGSWKLLRVT